MSAIALLRSRTAAAHDAVDAAFGQHDLQDRDAYTAFLLAHARALPAAEAEAAIVWPALRPRMPALTDDLAALGISLPRPFAASQTDTAGAWGSLYVVEGSRLGGGMLAKRVDANLPHAYLAAVHLPGEWRDIRLAIDRAAELQDEAWHETMVTGALHTFDRYAAAAQNRSALIT